MKIKWQKWGLQLLQSHQDKNINFPLHFRILSTIFILLGGALLYLDTVLDLFFNLDKPVPNFLTLRNFIYAMGGAISPMLIIFGSRMNPNRLSYIAPLYAYSNSIIGYIFLYNGYQVTESWVFRFMILLFAIVLLFLLIKINNFYHALAVSDKLKNKILDSVKKQLNDEKLF